MSVCATKQQFTFRLCTAGRGVFSNPTSKRFAVQLFSKSTKCRCTLASVRNSQLLIYFIIAEHKWAQIVLTWKDKLAQLTLYTMQVPNGQQLKSINTLLWKNSSDSKPDVLLQSNLQSIFASFYQKNWHATLERGFPAPLVHMLNVMGCWSVG